MEHSPSDGVAVVAMSDHILKKVYEEKGEEQDHDEVQVSNLLIHFTTEIHFHIFKTIKFFGTVALKKYGEVDFSFCHLTLNSVFAI